MGQQETWRLPDAFVARMKDMLGDECDAFLASYEKERALGLRVNTLKVPAAEFAEKNQAAFSLRPVSWCREGLYYAQESRPGRHPYHEAGAYYIQEPSAMAVVSLLEPKPGEKVLDLCAAPGGKTTHIASRLEGCGLLVSNEIHPARAKILSQNVERMGIGNAIVTNEDSGSLARFFPDFFDCIVVDAPCSGEGMFRKDEQARNEWSEANVKLCAERQQEILDKLEAERTVRGHNRNLVVAATGTGKTVISALDYKRFCKQHPGKPCRLLFVAHREEILKQSLYTFRAVLKDANFGELLVGNYKVDSIEHLFISIQTFNSQDFTAKTGADFYDYIVVDEFHHAAAPTYQKLLEYYQPQILLGLTATPERMDGKSILD